MRELYVSPTDAFLWIGAPDGLPWSIDYANRRRQACPAGASLAGRPASQSAMLYRLPLDGGAVGAVARRRHPGRPVRLRQPRRPLPRLARAQPAPAASSRTSSAPLALLDLPLAAFGDRVRHVSGPAPMPPCRAIAAGELENRFVGPWLVYGGAQRLGEPTIRRAGGTRAASTADRGAARAGPPGAMRLALPHNALRIERAGNDAVVTGYRDARGLSLSYVSLGRRRRASPRPPMLPRPVRERGPQPCLQRLDPAGRQRPDRPADDASRASAPAAAGPTARARS